MDNSRGGRGAGKLAGVVGLGSVHSLDASEQGGADMVTTFWFIQDDLSGLEHSR